MKSLMGVVVDGLLSAWRKVASAVYALTTLWLTIAIAEATPVLFNLKLLTGTDANRAITITPTNAPGWTVPGTNAIFLSQPITLQAVNGVAQTNLAPGVYRLTFAGLPGSILIAVPETNVVLQAHQLAIQGLTIYTYTNPISSLIGSTEYVTTLDPTKIIVQTNDTLYSIGVGPQVAITTNAITWTALQTFQQGAHTLGDLTGEQGGTVRWRISAGGVFTGNGSGLTNLNASELRTGTIDVARLPTSVALTNRAQTFYGDTVIRTNLTATGTIGAAIGVFTNNVIGNGAGLTNLDASALASGTVPADRLPAELAWTNRPQTFFGNLEVRTNITTTNLIVRSTATVDALRFTTNTIRIGSDTIPATGTTGYFQGVFIGGNAGPIEGNANEAVVVGWQAGQYASNTIARSVIAGTSAGRYATNAVLSVLIGYGAGAQGNLQDSVAIGRFAGYETFYSPFSVLVGGFAGRSATNAPWATMLGYEAGAYAPGGTNMVAVGQASGRNATNSGWSVFIGDGAGRNFEDSPYNIVIGGIRDDATSRVDRLMIHSRNTPIPLIYGEFDNRLLRVHGWLDVTNKMAASLFEGNAAGLTNLPVSGIAAGGTRDGTTFLRGDGQWAVPPGGGGGGGTTEYVASADTNHIVVTTNLPVYTLDVGHAVARTNRAQTFYGDLSVRTNLDVLNLVTAATGIFSGRIIGNLAQATNLPVSGISASGVPDSSTFLRGDGTWAVPGPNDVFIVAPRATGNGAVDWPNLQAALDQTTNATHLYGARTYVIIPPGIYVITQQLTLRAHGITVWGSGVDRTLITQQSSTAPVFVVHGVTGNYGGTNQLWWAEIGNMRLTKTLEPISVSTSRAFDFETGVSGSQKASRLILRRIKVDNFYIGVYIGHGVGLLAEQCEMYGNNYGFYLAHADNAELNHVYLGDAEHSTHRTNLFQAPHSAGIVWRPLNTVAGKVLTLRSFEGRRVNNILAATNGIVRISAGNLEVMATGPTFVFHAPFAVDINGVRVTRVNTNYNPVILYSGACEYLRVHGLNLLDDLSPSPPIWVNPATAALPHYSGMPVTVSNVANGLTYTAPFFEPRVSGPFLRAGGSSSVRLLGLDGNSTAQGVQPTNGVMLVGTNLVTTNIPVSSIAATGTRDSTTFLRGDGTWAQPSSGGLSNPPMPGLTVASDGTNQWAWYPTAVAPGSEIISMWAQAPNSGTSPASSPGASFTHDGAVAMTTTNSSGQAVAGNLLLRTNASGVTTRIRYGGSIQPRVRALMRVYHVLAVDHPADLNVYAGWISANAGGQTDWPSTATTHAIFYSTNGVWHAFVRRSTTEAVNVPIGVNVEPGRAYRLSINRNADGSLGFFINNRLVATVDASNAPPDDDPVFPLIWARTKSATTLDWRWYKSQVDYMPDPWP